MFRLMPPQRHDADPDRSEVLAYIKDNLRCELGRAIRAFNSMRNKKSQVLVYDMVHRQWRGCDWVPMEDEDKVSLLLKTINDLKRDVAYLKTSVKKHERLLGQLERKRSRKRDREEEDETVEPASDPQQQEAAPPEKEEAAPKMSDAEWRASMIALLDDEPEASVPSVEPLSSPSGSTGPTRFRWESAEGLVPMP